MNKFSFRDTVNAPYLQESIDIFAFWIPTTEPDGWEFEWSNKQFRVDIQLIEYCPEATNPTGWIRFGKRWFWNTVGPFRSGGSTGVDSYFPGMHTDFTLFSLVRRFSRPGNRPLMEQTHVPSWEPACVSGGNGGDFPLIWVLGGSMTGIGVVDFGMQEIFEKQVSVKLYIHFTFNDRFI